MNTVEEANRQAKARRIADALAGHGPEGMTCTEIGDRVAKWSDLEWAHVARTFDERAPSAETRQQVVSLLRTRGRAAERGDSPFDGLPA